MITFKALFFGILAVILFTTPIDTDHLPTFQHILYNGTIGGLSGFFAACAFLLIIKK